MLPSRIAIDLNVRVGGRQTYAGFEDVRGSVPQVGDLVTVFESESEVEGNARVTSIDGERALIYLNVDWTSLAPAIAAQPSGFAPYLTSGRLFVGGGQASTMGAAAPRAERPVAS